MIIINSLSESSIWSDLLDKRIKLAARWRQIEVLVFPVLSLVKFKWYQKVLFGLEQFSTFQNQPFRPYA